MSRVNDDYCGEARRRLAYEGLYMKGFAEGRPGCYPPASSGI